MTAAAAPIPILARTPAEKCARCGAEVFYSPERISGVMAAVSIDGPGSTAPDRYNEGVGILHVCPPNADASRQRELSPL